MKFKTLLSYKQIRKIDIDTQSADIQLGADDFTIAIAISPYYNQGYIGSNLLTNEIFSKSSNQFNDNIHDFFPIFTYNKTILYDYENKDSKDYFYNTHACYIYKRKIHWLINGISDKPLLHLTLNMSKINILQKIKILLTRHKNMFIMQILQYDKRDGYETNFPKSVSAIVDNINLDYYTNKVITIGYAERVPIQSNGIIYKNTLKGNLDYFKIFNVSKTLLQPIPYRHDAHFQDVDFENLTKNSKYNLNDIIYHNKNLDICKTNQLITKGEEKCIKKINYIGLKINNLYNQQEFTQTITDDISVNQSSNNYTKENLSKEYIIITMDFERILDSTNIEFYQKVYTVTGSYDIRNANYQLLEMSSDEYCIENINGIKTIYDIYKVYSDKLYLVGDYNVENIAYSDYGNNYIQFINTLNNFINCLSDDISLTNIKIKSSNNLLYYFYINLKIASKNIKTGKFYQKIKTSDNLYNTTNFIERGFAQIPDANSLNKSFFKQIKDNYYFQRYTHNINCAICSTQYGVGFFYNNVLKYNRVNSRLSDISHDEFDGNILMYPKSYNEQMQLFNIIDMHLDNYINTSEMLVGWHTSNSNIPIREYYGSTQFDYIKHFSIELSNGDILGIIVNVKNVISEILNILDIKYILSHRIFIYAVLNNDDKYFVQELSWPLLQAHCIGITEIAANNDVIEADENISASFSNDLSEIKLVFNKDMTLNTTENFIIATYDNKLLQIDDKWSNTMSSMFTVQKDNVLPENNLYAKYGHNYIYNKPIVLIDVRSMPPQDFKCYNNPNFLNYEDSLLEYKINIMQTYSLSKSEIDNTYKINDI